ncbi:MAG: hypothetical protein P1P86_03295 [Bacteroidales bacterium]|nr:hypothetical protein [Bacteroidales bacterium]
MTSQRQTIWNPEPGAGEQHARPAFSRMQNFSVCRDDFPSSPFL